MSQASANLIERGIVSTLWQEMDNLLTSEHGSVDTALTDLSEALPDVTTLDAEQLPKLAELHLRSASDLMTAIRLLGPSSFRSSLGNGSSSEAPSPASLSTHPTELLDETVAGMESALIAMQLFHLQRASVLVQHRRRILGQPDAPSAAAQEECSCSHSRSHNNESASSDHCR